MRASSSSGLLAGRAAGRRRCVSVSVNTPGSDLIPYVLLRKRRGSGARGRPIQRVRTTMRSSSHYVVAVSGSYYVEVGNTIIVAAGSYELHVDRRPRHPAREATPTTRTTASAAPMP